jgi:hypothetical protein
MILVLMAKGSYGLAHGICDILCSQLNESYKCRELAFAIESVLSRPLTSLIAATPSLLPLRLLTYL